MGFYRTCRLCCQEKRRKSCIFLVKQTICLKYPSVQSTTIKIYLFFIYAHIPTSCLNTSQFVGVARWDASVGESWGSVRRVVQQLRIALDSSRRRSVIDPRARICGRRDSCFCNINRLCKIQYENLKGLAQDPGGATSVVTKHVRCYRARQLCLSWSFRQSLSGNHVHATSGNGVQDRSFPSESVSDRPWVGLRTHRARSWTWPTAPGPGRA
jgi:hypothetical protein